MQKIALVLLGYGLALVGAIVVAYLEDLRTSAPAFQGSQGMTSFNLVIVFTGVLAVLSIPPTALGLWFLRSWEKLWTFLTFAAPALALTALLALGALVTLRTLQLWTGVWMALDLLAMVRIFGAPVLGVAFGVISWIAPSRRARWALRFAAAIEFLVSGYVLFNILTEQRLA